MSKIKLKKQNNYEFEYKITLQVTDINYGGHLGNHALVGIIHQARVNLLRDLGASEFDLGDGKTGIIMADLGVNYLGEGFMFDEIVAHSHIGEINNASFRIFHKITKEDKIVALVETGIIAFDYTDRRIVQIPDSFIQVLNKYIKGQKNKEKNQ